MASIPGPDDTPGARPHRACRHCVQIKAKCIPIENSNTSTCQRCRRLGKECTTPAPLPRKRYRVKSNKVSQLEERIETLTSLITSGRTNFCTTVTSPPTSTALPTPPVSVSQPGNEPGDLSSILESQYWTRPFSQRPRNHPGPDANGYFRVQVPAAYEEKLFKVFQTDMSEHFPFVVIPPLQGIIQFRLEHPFLFRACIAAAAHTDPPLQMRLGEDLLKYVGERMLLCTEKSLDMLQGLLVLIAWYQFYNHFNPQLMNLLHLCIALTIDLGLNRPQSLGQWQLRVVIDTTSLLHGKGVSQGLRTTDEHRALLGVYFLCAKLSYAFKRLDPMRYTQHLEDCCQFLLTEAEYPSDITLVQHVRLQHILEKYMPDAMGLSALSVPVRSFVKCFEEDIKNFKQSVPRDLLPSAHLEIHILSAQIGLYEFVQTADLDPLIHRIEAWYACLNCISQYWDLFLAEPSENLPTLTFISWLHTIQPLLMLAKLSFLITDGWDLDFVRTKWAFGAFIDRLAEKLESVTRTDVSHTHRTVGARFNMYAEKMRMCKRWYESKIRAENAVKASEAAATLPERPVPNPPSPDIPFQDLFDGLEDGMWQDFMYDWAIPTQF